MPYRGGNFSFVVDSSFHPFTMQEILTPLTMYKDAYDKTEEAYTALADKADKFKYLSMTLPEDSEARQIYERYANDLKVQAEDLGKHGLTVNNRRALNSLRNRYQGEIGMLADAQDALTKERELRRQMSAKDPSMLYGANNLTINDYLYGNTPSQYSVSGDALFTRGAAIGKSMSSRMYEEGDGGSTLGGYYRKWISKRGVGPKSIEAFMQSDEVQQEINRQMKATGAEDNLTGIDKDRARYQLESGLYNGIVYEQSIKPVRDEGVLTKDQELDNARANRTQLVNEAMNGISWQGNTPVYNKDNDLTLQRQLAAIQERAAATAAAKAATEGAGRGTSSEYRTVNQNGVRLEWRGNNPNPTNGEDDNRVKVKPLDKDEERIGSPVNYDDLPPYIQTKVDFVVGPNGDVDDYEYYYRPYEGNFFNDTEAAVDIVPRNVKKHNAEEEENTFDFNLQ